MLFNENHISYWKRRPLKTWLAVAVTAAVVIGGIITLVLVQGAGTYRVVNNVIHDPAGKVFYPHGVDRPSLEWGCTGDSIGGTGSGIATSDYTTMKNGWGANTVRIALNQDFWLPSANRHCAGYQATVASNVAAARSAGLVVILDLHWSDKGDLANTSPGQQCMADANSITFWQQLAAAYKADSGVWFELYNEPHNIEWPVWQNGGAACGFETVGMQQLANTVRSAGAANIVVAGGFEWGSRLDGVPLLSGSNIAYAIHPYAKDIVPGGNPNEWSVAEWDHRFGYLAAKAPVIATEFGHLTCGSSTYDAAILEYFRTHGIGYTAWAWYNGGCGFPSLISDAAGHCVNGGCSIQQDMLAFAGGTRQMVTPAYTGPTAAPTPTPTSTPAPTPTATPPPNITDFTGDGKTNVFDLSILLSHWGTAGSGDVDGNGTVNVFDLSQLLSCWTG